MGEVIVITSGKGGVGKTTTSANIGMGLARLGKKVLLVDTDIGLRNLDVLVGLENKIIYNFIDIIEGQCTPEQAIVFNEDNPNLSLLASAQTKDKSVVLPEEMKKLMDQISPLYDYIVIDCPAGIEQGFQIAVAGATRAVIVTTPEISAIRDADRIIGLLRRQGIKPLELVINKMRLELIRQGEMMTPEEVMDILPVDLIGTIPDADEVVVSTIKGFPIVNNDTEIGNAFLNISKRIIGENVPYIDFLKQKKIFGFFKNKKRKS